VLLRLRKKILSNQKAVIKTIRGLSFRCALLLFLASALNGVCSETNSVKEAAKSYSARGVIKKIASDRRQVTIHHQAITGYMMEMTMDFPVKDTDVLNGLSSGDNITFTLVVDQNNDWVENVHRTGRTAEVPVSATTAFHVLPELNLGDLLPDGELVADDGRHVHLSDFHGKAVAFTFFFTRCPLPNYCPLMNHDFAATRDLILSTPNALTNWQFISISFDPGFDTPDTLSGYASFYRGSNADRWLFTAATTNTLAELAPRLGLMIMHQGTGISHNLRTVVLDPQGRIYRQFDNNGWTPQELADAMLEAARGQTSKTK
jgi:protein SCO1